MRIGERRTLPDGAILECRRTYESLERIRHRLARWIRKQPVGDRRILLCSILCDAMHDETPIYDGGPQSRHQTARDVGYFGTDPGFAEGSLGILMREVHAGHDLALEHERQFCLARDARAGSPETTSPEKDGVGEGGR